VARFTLLVQVLARKSLNIEEYSIFVQTRLFLLLFEYSGGGVHTGSTRHCGHSWPIVSDPGDCEDGEVGGMNGFGRGNRSTRRKPATTPLCPP
jgi:hypothetical protein